MMQTFILSDNLLNILNSQVTNYRRFKWAHYDKEGITFTKDVKSKDCTETITLYNKEKEICTSHNKDFLNSLSQPQSVIDYFKGKTRFEITLNTVKKIMNYLNFDRYQNIQCIKFRYKPYPYSI